MAVTLRSALLVTMAAGSIAHAQAVPDEVKVKTATEEYALKHEGVEWKVRGPACRERVLRVANDGLALLENKQVALRAVCGADRGVRVTDKSGAIVNELQPTPEGFDLFGPGHALAYRVKVKLDKANVYDAKAARVAHAKAKDDGFSVRDANDAQTAKVKGLSTLAQAAYFALPIELGEAALLWRACP